MPEYAVDVDADSREVYLINLSTAQVRMDKLRLLKNTLLVVLLFVAIFVLVLLGWHVLLLIQHQQAIVKKFATDDALEPQRPMVSEDFNFTFPTTVKYDFKSLICVFVNLFASIFTVYPKPFKNI